MVYLLLARMKRMQSKMATLECSQDFPNYNLIGPICCHKNQSSDPIWSKTLCSLLPHPMMLQMKFNFNRPVGLRDVCV